MTEIFYDRLTDDELRQLAQHADKASVRATAGDTLRARCMRTREDAEYPVFDAQQPPGVDDADELEALRDEADHFRAAYRELTKAVLEAIRNNSVASLRGLWLEPGQCDFDDCDARATVHRGPLRFCPQHAAQHDDIIDETFDGATYHWRVREADRNAEAYPVDGQRSGTIEQAVSVATTYCVDIDLVDVAGFRRGWVHADGEWELT